MLLQQGQTTSVLPSSHVTLLVQASAGRYKERQEGRNEDPHSRSTQIRSRVVPWYSSEAVCPTVTYHQATHPSATSR
ncbi:hypothetical protein E2C01_071372 [Portunus trituberculatus]|uniref:Uncharacterized protein n=1 Tax=Portunus trituberculatus TaxID=210409 RepID=A0A5B7I4B0_PORTR|nr:hypothetical protein [Portunus trituberculatus]